MTVTSPCESTTLNGFVANFELMTATFLGDPPSQRFSAPTDTFSVTYDVTADY